MQSTTTSQESIRPTAILGDCLPILKKRKVYYDTVAAMGSSETSKMLTSHLR